MADTRTLRNYLNSLPQGNPDQLVGQSLTTLPTVQLATAAQGAKADTAVQPGSLSTVATTGEYDDLNGKPVLGDLAALDEVAIANIAAGGAPNSGTYLRGDGQWNTPAGAGDMSQAVYDPTSVNADAFDRANHHGSISAGDIGGLAAVATSGDYDDLDNRPTLGSAAGAAVSDFATAAQGGLADTAVQPAAIADMLETSDIDSTVQAYDADTAKTDTAQSWSGPQRPAAPTALSIVSNEIDWTLASGQDFDVTMDDDGELQLPSDIASYVGQRGRIMFIQDGTGGHTLTVDAGFEILNSDTLPDILQDPNAKTACYYDVIATDTVLLAFGGVGAAL